MKIGKLSSFERKFIERLRELTVGMAGEDFAWWQERALENFEEHRPYTLEESEAMDQWHITRDMMNNQYTKEEQILAIEEDREPRPFWETNP